ncbi:MAG: hypothetical protein MK089_11815 [Phycisphaerales bacterium]|nr:hypothetical protein [Phycisphaerales bacterium]
MPLPPMQFKPLLKPKVWGGRSLELLGKQLPPEESVGESWELADLPDEIADGRSLIAGGLFDGQTLQDVLDQDAMALLGRTSRSPEGGFPLLLKYLDAHDNLSVQVHPDDAYVADHPEAHLKSEAWFILEAQPGSVIYAGLKPGTTPEDFASSIEDGTVVDHLVAIPARPGDCHYLPSGTCHALGAGVLVAEVQTPSDTTFRVWDWGRTSRELHVEQAMACIDFSGTSIEQPRPHSTTTGNHRLTRLADTDYFRIERVESFDPGEMILETQGVPEAFMVLDGEGTLSVADHSMSLKRGDTFLLPADMEQGLMKMKKPMDFLKTTMLPST